MRAAYPVASLAVFFFSLTVPSPSRSLRACRRGARLGGRREAAALLEEHAGHTSVKRLVLLLPLIICSLH